MVVDDNILMDIKYLFDTTSHTVMDTQTNALDMKAQAQITLGVANTTRVNIEPQKVFIGGPIVATEPLPSYAGLESVNQYVTQAMV